jgi:hypothetical protein
MSSIVLMLLELEQMNSTLVHVLYLRRLAHPSETKISIEVC